MRKYLGVLGGVAALCVMSWAQVPAPTPTPAQAPAQAPAPEPTPIPVPPPPASRASAPQYPRFELFGGGTYAETGLFNAGHWAGLPGWDASLGANATSWLGFVLEGGQYFGTSKIPSLVPAPFPSGPNSSSPTPSPTFNVATREYNFLFGAQFSRRKYGRWTPFGELLYGHQGIRGVATRRPGSFRRGNRHGPGDSGRRRPRPQNQSAFGGAVQGRLFADRLPLFRFPASRSRTTSGSRWALFSAMCTRRSARSRRKLSPNRKSRGDCCRAALGLDPSALLRADSRGRPSLHEPLLVSDDSVRELCANLRAAQQIA